MVLEIVERVGCTASLQVVGACKAADLEYPDRLCYAPDVFQLTDADRAVNTFRNQVLFHALFQQPFLFPICLTRGLFSRIETDMHNKVGKGLTELAITRC